MQLRITGLVLHYAESTLVTAAKLYSSLAIAATSYVYTTFLWSSTDALVALSARIDDKENANNNRKYDIENEDRLHLRTAALMKLTVTITFQIMAHPFLMVIALQIHQAYIDPEELIKVQKIHLLQASRLTSEPRNHKEDAWWLGWMIPNYFLFLSDYLSTGTDKVNCLIFCWSDCVYIFAKFSAIDWTLCCWCYVFMCVCIEVVFCHYIFAAGVQMGQSSR